MRAELALSALIMAVQRQRPERALIHHSDRASQFAAEACAKPLAVVGAVPSMSRTASCDDTAPMESLFHTLRVELVHQHHWTPRDNARRDPFQDIEGYHNHARIHAALGYLTPQTGQEESKLALRWRIALDALVGAACHSAGSVRAASGQHPGGGCARAVGMACRTAGRLG